MTRYRKLMAAQGSERSLYANGRRWVIGISNKHRMLSEVLSESDGCIQSFPGFWHGQPRLGFATLEGAGAYRRMAMRERDEFRRKSFMRKCREAINDSIAYRMVAEQAERTRQIYAERYAA